MPRERQQADGTKPSSVRSSRQRAARRRHPAAISAGARSREAVWLALAGGLIVLGAALLGVAGVFDAASKVSYSYWTSLPVIVAYVAFGLSLLCFACAITDVPIPYPVSRRTAEPSADLVAVQAEERSAFPAAPPCVRLTVERDVAMGGFCLGVLNRAAPGRFRAEVVGIRDQDGQAPHVTEGEGPLPWLEDGSVSFKDIPTAGRPRLDFAYFNLANLREDLEGAKWLNGDHWSFPALPKPITIRYPAVRTWQEQDRQHFVVTVRVISDDPPGFADTEFKIGTEGQQPYCREQIAELATPPEPAAGELVPGPARTDRWRSTTRITGDLLQLQNNGMSHPAYMSRSPQQPPPASIRVGIVMACDPLPRDTPPTSAIRASFLAFLAKPDITDLIGGLTNITGKTWKAWDESPRFSFGAVLAGDDENDTPAAWARLLLPESGVNPFGHDRRCADLLVYIEPDMAPAGDASPGGLAVWHHRFARAIRFPASLARFLASELGLATSSDPAPEMAIWLKARGASLTELVNVSGLTVIPGPQAN